MPSAPTPPPGPSNWFRLYNGINAASSYSSAGQVGVGAAGCGIGAVFTATGPIGCVAGGGIGWTVGGIACFGLGFYYGWTGSEKADDLDGVPAYTPNPFRP